MDSRGKAETKILQANIEQQLNRLMQQLKDLEDLTTEAGMDQQEIDEIKKSTKEQLIEFQRFLAKSKDGNMSLVDSINEAQLKIQEAISKAFNTKEVMDMYAARQGDYHRTQIEYLKAKFFTGKIDKETYIKETFDSLIALSKIDTLTPAEQKMKSDFEKKEFEAYTDASKKISEGSLFGKKTA